MHGIHIDSHACTGLEAWLPPQGHAATCGPTTRHAALSLHACIILLHGLGRHADMVDMQAERLDETSSIAEAQHSGAWLPCGAAAGARQCKTFEHHQKTTDTPAALRPKRVGCSSHEGLHTNHCMFCFAVHG